MIYDHMVKSNGIVYLAGEDVPEPAVIEEVERVTEEAEKIQEDEAFEEKPIDLTEELRSEPNVEEEKPKRTRRTK